MIINSNSKKIKMIYKIWHKFNYKSSKNMINLICKLLKIKFLIFYKKNYLINSKVLMKASYKKMLIFTIKLRKMKTNLRKIKKRRRN